MREKLLELCENSYAPYSNFKVSAILQTKDGKYFSGVNVENANFVSICAERNAFANAIAAGYKKGDFEKIYILSSSTDKIITPCFTCRQVLIEFMEMDKKVICISKKGEEKVFLLKELCPFPFTLNDLK